MLLLGRAVGITLPRELLQHMPSVNVSAREECSPKDIFNVCIKFYEVPDHSGYRLEIRGTDDNGATSFCSRIFVLREKLTVKLPVSHKFKAFFSEHIGKLCATWLSIITHHFQVERIFPKQLDIYLYDSSRGEFVQVTQAARISKYPRDRKRKLDPAERTTEKIMKAGPHD